MSTTADNPIQDLEALLAQYAIRPAEQVWLPISLFTFQDESVAVAIQPKSDTHVVVTDEGQTLATVDDLGLEVTSKSALARDIKTIASRRGFEFDGFVLRRSVSLDEIPTAALHLAEVEIAVSALLQLKLQTPSTSIFATRARRVLSERLRPKVAKQVRFGSEYTGKFKDGDFFCVAESKTPIGVKVVTNSNNMRDAVIAGLMYEHEPIELLALKNPTEQLGGPRVVQFATLYAGHTFTKPEKLAEFLNQRVA